MNKLAQFVVPVAAAACVSTHGGVPPQSSYDGAFEVPNVALQGSDDTCAEEPFDQQAFDIAADKWASGVGTKYVSPCEQALGNFQVQDPPVAGDSLLDGTSKFDTAVCAHVKIETDGSVTLVIDSLRDDYFGPILQDAAFGGNSLVVVDNKGVFVDIGCESDGYISFVTGPDTGDFVENSALLLKATAENPALVSIKVNGNREGGTGGDGCFSLLDEISASQ